MAKKVNKNHYVASSPTESMSPVHVHRGMASTNRAYSTDGEESQRAPSDRTMSEYMIANERAAATVVEPGNSRSHRRDQQRNGASKMKSSHYDNEGSEIYVTSAAYKAPSELSRGSRYSHHSRTPSHYSYRSGRAPSEVSTVKTKTSRKGGLVVETMAAPNPFCPNTKGICCLMLLINLGLILVTLGLVIVIQLFQPLFVWILGIVFVIFGFLTLIGSLIYCVIVCKDVKSPKDVSPEDLYWTHHWQKHIGSPEIHYKAEDKYPDDRYSDRYSVSKYSGKYSDRDRQSDHY
ncbi:uncharacterized protein LOC110828306 isoform X2 [Zootermopsis nevadensis]|uniref:Uncharacterized protein n=1 Tax=Zootermopsis nevadensis TaxID=136037 RepID=A0A067RKT8_ZOONE|nr:uncharacterized protein LOC110828306 isoform X2 [Zootermopsis nevadensis]KDR21200.1 hypothetical protein L798_03607 [Zootermopsis nevadensis]